MDAPFLSHAWLDTPGAFSYQALTDLAKATDAIGSSCLSRHGIDHVPGSQHELASTDEADLTRPRAADPRAAQRRCPSRFIGQHRHPELLANHLRAFAAQMV